MQLSSLESYLVPRSDGSLNAGVNVRVVCSVTLGTGSNRAFSCRGVSLALGFGSC